MKKRVFAAFLAMMLLVCAVGTAFAQIDFSQKNISEDFFMTSIVFFEMLEFDEELMIQAALLTALVVDEEATEKYGVDVYASQDGHVLIAAEDFLFSYTALTDESVLKNIPQIILSYSLTEFIGFEEFEEIFVWVSTGFDPDKMIYKGIQLDGYTNISAKEYAVYLFVNSNQNLDELKYSENELIEMAQEILY